jgi:hypothetical protein
MSVINRSSPLKFVSLIFIMTFILPVSAQKIRRAEGEAQVRVESNITREQAQQKAVELAKVNALENVFGTYVEQQANLTVDSGKSDFYIIGSTKVKGIWIRETDRKFTEEYRDEKGEFGTTKILWITCHIRGEVKQVTPRPAIEYQVRNCTFPTCRTFSFKSGEQLYLWFKSPVDGYLSVFLDDGSMVYRLLPYSDRLNTNSFGVRGDEGYLFFSPEATNGLQPGEKPDEIELYTLQKKENNLLILVFSTNLFFKPGLNKEKAEANRYILPKSLEKEKFEEWLSDNRATYDDFQDVQIPIEILSKK